MVKDGDPYSDFNTDEISVVFVGGNDYKGDGGLTIGKTYQAVKKGPPWDPYYLLFDGDGEVCSPPNDFFIRI